MKFAKIKNYFYYILFFIKGLKKKWFHALFLDLLLHDIHISKLKKNRVQFTNIFFNSLAHIQHHYFFNSIFSENNRKNPEWYLKKDDDPLKDGLTVFNFILNEGLSII